MLGIRRQKVVREFAQTLLFPLAGQLVEPVYHAEQALLSKPVFPQRIVYVCNLSRRTHRQSAEHKNDSIRFAQVLHGNLRTYRIFIQARGIHNLHAVLEQIQRPEQFHLFKGALLNRLFMFHAHRNNHIILDFIHRHLNWRDVLHLEPPHMGKRLFRNPIIHLFRQRVQKMQDRFRLFAIFDFIDNRGCRHGIGRQDLLPKKRVDKRALTVFEISHHHDLECIR